MTRIGLLFVSFLMLGALYAQDKPQEKTDPHEEIPETYLDRAIAVKKIEHLRQANRRDLQRLYVLVQNYGKDIPESTQDLDKLKASYKEALHRYYQRDAFAAEREFSETRENILALYKKFGDKYKEQVSALLADCSSKLVDMDLDAANAEPGTEVSITQQRGQYKLRIAHNQLNLAEDRIRENRHDVAIDHLRLAKLFAISVLQTLEKDPNKQKELESKYRIDILDASGVNTAAAKN